MIKRYADPRNAENWSLPVKFGRWQEVELAVIEAREKLGRIPSGTHQSIKNILESHLIDIQFILDKEKELEHDLLSFLAERSQHLLDALKQYLHADEMTSYDDEEPAFAEALQTSCDLVMSDIAGIGGLFDAIKEKALTYSFTVWYRRTHGQGAELESFGRCCLAWHQDLKAAVSTLDDAMKMLAFSKLSGMIGTNAGMDPELEKEALAILGFKPWIGATQIMPRVCYSPIADALANIASVIEKISLDIWLNARSGHPLLHEPFKKTQKGSSAGPHKRNPIYDEQNRGMGNMARSQATSIKNTIVTPEGRDISQSCVERVMWPDLFDVTLRAIKNLTRSMKDLRVYPDNMIVEILESRGTYAASKAKEVLTVLGLPFGLSRDDAYGIVQLASFKAFEPDEWCRELRANPPRTPEEMDEAVKEMYSHGYSYADLPTIQQMIPDALLDLSPELEFNHGQVERWNAILRDIFSPDRPENQRKWDEIFKPSFILKHEHCQFEQVFGTKQ